MASIIQWNCNGLNYDKRNELKILEKKLNPFAIAMQETKFQFNFKPEVKGYKVYYQNIKTDFMPKWGVITLVKESLESKEIKLNTKFNAVAVEIVFPTKFILCNVYWSVSDSRTEQEFNNLINQLGENFLMVGDFNSHHLLWGSHKTNVRGKMIEKLITEHEMIILNSGKATHLDYSKKTFSAIDLTLSSRNFNQRLSWDTERDTHTSDHFPIVLKLANERQNIRNVRKFQIKKANWEQFRENLNIRDLTPQNFLTVNSQEIEFTNLLFQAAKKSIPLTSGNPSPRFAPWWNQEIANSIKKRKKALNNFRARGIFSDHAEYMKESRKSRNLIREEKRKSWELFVNGTNDDTTARLYSKVKALAGTNRIAADFTIIVNDRIVEDPKNIAEIFAKRFQKASKISSYDGNFITKMISQEEIMPPESDEVETFNRPFSLDELNAALKKSKGSSPGMDKIHYDMMKQMNEDAKLIYLNLVNRIWSSRSYPQNWSKTLAIPIPKGKRDITRPENYRPIQLENVPSKVMQKMVSNRLNWIMDQKKIISDDQSGFRRKRSTLDATTKIVNGIQEAIRAKKFFVTIHFDIEKAYDTVWRQNILLKLAEKNIGGNIYHYVKNFMDNRKFQTIVNGQLSEEKQLETGLVQGAVLSVPLFLIGMESVSDGVESLSNEIIKVSFADDLTIGVEGKNLATIEETAQKVVDLVVENAKNVGFKISKEKTKFMIFSGKKKINRNVMILLEGSLIERVKKIDFLGVTLDEKLTWADHIKKVTLRGKKRLNVLKMLRNKRFGAKRNTLLNLNKSIVISALDYGAELYQMGSKTAKKPLDAILNEGVRIATGAFKTSPAISVLREANCLPLEARRTSLRAKYAIRIKQNQRNPLKQKVNIERRNNVRRRTICESFVEDLRKLKVNEPIVEDAEEDIGIWEMEIPKINITLSSTAKHAQSNEKLKADALYEIQKYENYVEIYTDGSKIEDRVGFGVWSKEKEINGRLNNHASIFTAEMYAIIKAIDLVEKANGSHFLIISDSLSCLKALGNYDSKDTITNRTKYKLAKIRKHVEFLWIPSHIGINGNDKADKLAKDGTNKRFESSWLTKKDAYKIIDKNIVENQEKEWIEKEVENKLRETMRTRKHVVKQNLMYKKFSRQDNIVLTRLKIGHTKITHEYLFDRRKQKTRCNCGEIITVRHILDNCNLFNTIRNKHKVKFKNLRSKNVDHLRGIIDYLKEIDMYDKI